MEKILVKEDDKSIREELVTLLKANGYMPVSEPPCDLALLDINLPGESGFEVCQKLRQTASFFFQPLLLPLLFSIPVGWWFGKLLMMHGCEAQIHEMYLTTAIIDLIIIALYTLYFTATYQIAKRSVVQRTGQ